MRRSRHIQMVTIIAAAVGNFVADLVRPYADDRNVNWLPTAVRVVIIVAGVLAALDLLEIRFAEDIVNAVRLHVAAKRYLCGSKPAYFDKLSEASKMTLEIQGGPMTDEEIFAFRNQPGHEMAVQVRVYDDRGKVNGMERPELDHYVPMIRRCLNSRQRGN